MPPDDTTPDRGDSFEGEIPRVDEPVTYPYRQVGVSAQGLIIHTIFAPGCYFTVEIGNEEIHQLIDKMHELQAEDEQGPQLKLVRTRRDDESED